MHVPVPYWTDDAGYCKPFPGLDLGVHRRFGLRPITLLTGQSLLFKYSTHHDVWAHPTLESLQACDYSSAVQLASRLDGGNCSNDADLSCIANGVGYSLTPSQDEMYLSCSVHDHCENGQRLVVTVVPAPCPHEMMPSADDTRRANAILLVEGVFGACVAILLLVLGACVLLCCVLRYARSINTALMRKGIGGPAPTFNRLDTEMVAAQGAAGAPSRPGRGAV